MTQSENILIIDADTELAQQLALYLTREGFYVSYAQDSENGIKKALNHPFEVIILDLTLIPFSGHIVIKTLREHIDTPILILTAQNDTIDKVMSLELGADEYLHKPCNPQELLAHIHALQRRAHKSLAQRGGTLSCQNIILDSAKRIVTVAGITLELTNTEFNILETLMKSPNQAFSKEELTEYALGRKYTAYDRSIDVHISNLRNKLGNNETGEDFIKTVRGFGYLFNNCTLAKKSNS